MLLELRQHYVYFQEIIVSVLNMLKLFMVLIL
jgi:hypothetical protein